MQTLRLIFALAFLIAVPAVANAVPWVLTQKSGQVQVARSGLQPASLSVNAKLQPGDVVTTGANGRAMFTRESDYIVIAPASRLALPAEAQPTGVTRLIQQLGTLFYKVKHTGRPDFSVQAPMLAAVVKGTSFTVIVDETTNIVQVTDGVVEVSTSSGLGSKLVSGGKAVAVSRERPNEVIELDPSKTAPVSEGSQTTSIESSGDIPLATIVGLTNGLVRADPAAVRSPVVSVAVEEGLATAPVTAIAATVAPGDGSNVTGTVSVAPVTIPSTEVPAATVPPLTAPGVTIPATSSPIVTTPAITTPTITTPTVPTPTVPAPTVPAPTVPAPTVPAPTVPSPTVPAPTVPLPTVPAPTVPAPTVPAPTVPAPTVPAPTVPAPTVPAPTVPAPTIPTPTLPAPPVPTLPGG